MRSWAPRQVHSAGVARCSTAAVGVVLAAGAVAAAVLAGCAVVSGPVNETSPSTSGSDSGVASSGAPSSGVPAPSSPGSTGTGGAGPAPGAGNPQSGGVMPAAASVVPATLFGMVEQGLPAAPDRSGAQALRIWDDGVTWRQLQPSRGTPNWGPLDAAVSNARATGVKDLLYVLGSTPLWAAAKSRKGEIYGPGSASHPRNDSDYLDFAGQVARRYRGKITSYQVWNEADLPDFYNGDPGQLAALTTKTYRLIKSIDPTAQVAAAGMVPRQGRFAPGSFEDRYLAGLAAAGWPVDAFAFSLYPERPDPSLRGQYLSIAQQALQRVGAPAKQIWESEVNYGSPQMQTFSDTAQRRLVAVSYLDSMQLGVSRSYWYSWRTQLPQLGVRMTTPSGSSTAGARAYRVIMDWMAGKSWHGCSTASGVTRCDLGSGPSTAAISYRAAGTSTLTAPAGARERCSLDGHCRSIKAGAAYTVGAEPVLIRLG